MNNVIQAMKSTNFARVNKPAVSLSIFNKNFSTA